VPNDASCYLSSTSKLQYHKTLQLLPSGLPLINYDANERVCQPLEENFMQEIEISFRLSPFCTGRHPWKEKKETGKKKYFLLIKTIDISQSSIYNTI